MANELQIFESSDFGSVRTVMMGKEPYFVGKDVAEILGYRNPNEAIQDHVDSEDKFLRSERGSEMLKLFSSMKDMQEQLGRQDNWFINESGVYTLIFGSKLPAAKKFKRWVTHEVLPAIRKTGSYSTMPSDKQAFKEQELKTRMLNARVRESNQYLKIAAQIDIPEYRYILQAKSAEALNNGVPVLPMQEVERKTYSATEIGAMFGVSAHKIGKLAKIHNLKTTEYGKWFYDKAAYSAKEVETWRYYESAIPVFEGIFGREAV
jgi:hypothetical protein